MKSENITQLARSVCPNWMSPTGDAHYRDVKKALETAWRQGMTDAAQLCVKEFVGTHDGFVAKHACEKAILAAALPNAES